MEQNQRNSTNYTLCIAPMMSMTNRHYRFMIRHITKKTRLYSEMITCGALLHNPNAEQFLEFNTNEHPLALQLGGNQPSELAQCARMAEKHGYDEVNFNVGCPSPRVQKGSIGACLMANPQHVTDCMKAMQDAVSIPVTIKHRTGITNYDSWDHLTLFIATLAEIGCQTFIIHARMAVLGGLNPKENRTIPALNHEKVYRLKNLFPSLTIVINGGIDCLAKAYNHLHHTDGSMIGRAAYLNPLIFQHADTIIEHWRMLKQTRKIQAPQFLPKDIIPEHDNHDLKQVALETAYAMENYIKYEISKGTPLHHITAPMLNLFNSVPGARSYRRYISKYAHHSYANWSTVAKALSFIDAKNIGL